MEEQGDGFSRYYTKKEISGVECIERNFPRLPENKAECEKVKNR
jgi:hypothetical protein